MLPNRHQEGERVTVDVLSDPNEQTPAGLHTLYVTMETFGDPENCVNSLKAVQNLTHVALSSGSDLVLVLEGVDAIVPALLHTL